MLTGLVLSVLLSSALLSAEEHPPQGGLEAVHEPTPEVMLEAAEEPPPWCRLAEVEETCDERTGRCAPEPPPQERPHFWIGKGPDCIVEPEDCELYGFEYDVSHPRGPERKLWCVNNTRIRCVSPEAPPPADPTPANQLVFASYNIFERNYFISNDGQRERTCRIARWLAENHPDVDVITFQEAFMGGCAHDQKNGTLRALLDQHGFIYHVDQVWSFFRPQPGGIFIASRWPILEHDQFMFKSNQISWDMAAAKGVNYVKIIKTVEGVSQVYHVMGTHLISGSGLNFDLTRKQQVQEWHDFIREKNIPRDEPLVFGGDFNIDYYVQPDITSNVAYILHAKLNSMILGDLNYTSDSIWNDVLINALPRGGMPNQWLDYIMYSRDHLQPATATQQPVHATVSTPFPVCWCDECVNILQGYMRYDGKNCPEVANISHLSDHNPVIGRFIF